MEHWYDRDRHALLSCSIFRVDEVQRESESGERGTFYVLEATDWVTVIPVVYDGEGRRCFVMVEQYRHGSGRVTMEFPAGTVDPGETAESTGRRELREETGYAAQSFELIGELSPNPAFMANSTYTYVARATTPGQFVVPPAKAEEMYAPEVFGRGGTDRVVVES